LSLVKFADSEPIELAEDRYRDDQDQSNSGKQIEMSVFRNELLGMSHKGGGVGLSTQD
jgi:hypothetical protein